MTFAPWPPPPSDPWPESEQDSSGLGPDFPASPGDREKGRFRPSNRPRLTKVAVANDDGSDVAAAVLSVEEETLLELKAIRIGIQLMLAEFSSNMTDLRELALN